MIIIESYRLSLYLFHCSKLLPKVASLYSWAGSISISSHAPYGDNSKAIILYFKRCATSPKYLKVRVRLYSLHRASAPSRYSLPLISGVSHFTAFVPKGYFNSRVMEETPRSFGVSFNYLLSAVTIVCSTLALSPGCSVSPSVFDVLQATNVDPNGAHPWRCVSEI